MTTAPFDLRRLLRPLDPARFIARDWTRRARHIRGTPAKFRDLGFGARALRAVAGGPSVPAIIAQHHDVDGRPRGVVIEPPLAEPLYRAGMTVSFQGLDRLHPGPAACATAIKLGLHYPEHVAVNANWSPDGAGFGLHFDCHQTFILQLEGQKRWRFSPEPLVPFPPRNLSFGDPDAVAAFRRDHAWARLPMPDERAMVERVLRPGDVLYLPAGTPHRTFARGASLSLTVSCWRTSVVDLLWQELSSRLGHEATWRQPVPVFADAGRDGAPFPAAADAFLRDRLAELRSLVNGWTPRDLARTYFSSVSDVAPPAPPTPTGGRIRRRDPLRVPAPITCVPGRDGARHTVHVFAGGARLSVPASAGPFLARLARRRRFRAEDAMRWSGARARLDWSETREALEVLLSRGIIRREPTRRPR